eukprot:5103445-Heterocapsa_arctica.AAC.1
MKYSGRMGLITLPSSGGNSSREQELMKYSGRKGLEPLPSVRGNSSLAPGTLMDDVPLSAERSALRDSAPRSHEPLKPR